MNDSDFIHLIMASMWLVVFIGVFIFVIVCYMSNTNVDITSEQNYYSRYNHSHNINNYTGKPICLNTSRINPLSNVSDGFLYCNILLRG